MSSSSENGSEAGTPGNASSHCQSPGSSSTSPSPNSCSKHRGIKDQGEGEFKSASTNGFHTPEGVLTPPTDGDGPENSELEESEKLKKSNGRLKFFKDGMLCLELSHHDEGQKTKWVQIRGRSVIPQIVQVKKEAKIPCQFPQPSLFPSPSNSNHNQNSARVESITSHSMSDDGSSMRSSASPRIRDSSWRKQPVPQKCLSDNSDFYMMPATCVVSLKFRHEVQVKARLHTLRRPYLMPDFVNIFRDNLVPVERKCGLNVDSKLCPCDSSDSTGRTSNVVSGDRRKMKVDVEKKLTMQSVESKLLALAETNFKLKQEVENRNGTNGNSATTPRSPIKQNSAKLTKKEVRDQEFRRIDTKKSQQRNQEKIILSVPPGPFKKAQNDMDLTRNPSLPLNFSLQSNLHMMYGGDTTDGKTLDHGERGSIRVRTSSKDGSSRPRNTKKSKINNLNSIAKSSSSNSILKANIRPPEPAMKSSKIYHLNSLPEPNSHCVTPYSPPSLSSGLKIPDQDMYQGTVSKVISYTINSLLGNDSCNGNTMNDKMSLKHRFANSSSSAFSPPTDLSHYSRKGSPENEAANMKGKFPGFGVNEQDQSSFLRHLLDTSDPIPSTTNPSSPPSNKIPPTPPKKRSAINHHSSNNIPTKSRRSPKSGLNQGSHSVNTESYNSGPSKPESKSSAASTRPKSSPHESPKAVMGASAYQHYSSLLPAAFIQNLNPTNSFYIPPEPPVALHALSHMNYTGDTALNLSHKGGWSPYLFPPSSFHDRASSGCQDLSMNRRNLSPFSDSHQSMNCVDEDLPLNLCKKPRPN